MALNFPNNPVAGDTHNGINNIEYVFDGRSGQLLVQQQVPVLV